jgi:hypothetical protein
VNGAHYQRTAAAWRENLERHKDKALGVLSGIYGDDAGRWYHRWRIFFLACEELFGYGAGDEWLVGHYRFAPRPVVGPERDDGIGARESASWRASGAGETPGGPVGSAAEKAQN